MIINEEKAISDELQCAAKWLALTLNQIIDAPQWGVAFIGGRWHHYNGVGVTVITTEKGHLELSTFKPNWVELLPNRLFHQVKEGAKGFRHCLGDHIAIA